VVAAFRKLAREDSWVSGEYSGFQRSAPEGEVVGLDPHHWSSSSGLTDCTRLSLFYLFIDTLDSATVKTGHSRLVPKSEEASAGYRAEERSPVTLARDTHLA